MPPIPCIIPTTTKKEASEFRLQSAVVEKPLQGKTKMLANTRTSAFVALVALFEIFHVSDWSEQIANA